MRLSGRASNSVGGGIRVQGAVMRAVHLRGESVGIGFQLISTGQVFYLGSAAVICSGPGELGSCSQQQPILFLFPSPQNGDVTLQARVW